MASWRSSAKGRWVTGKKTHNEVITGLRNQTSKQREIRSEWRSSVTRGSQFAELTEPCHERSGGRGVTWM